MNIVDYVKPALYIVQYHCLRDGGYPSFAQQCLEQLLASNSEGVNVVQELLNRSQEPFRQRLGEWLGPAPWEQMWKTFPWSCNPLPLASSQGRIARYTCMWDKSIIWCGKV
jgi:hypothetical protein